MRFSFKAPLQIFLMAFLVNFTFLTGQSSAQVLLQQSDLVYQGAFRLPQGDFGSPQWSGFAYGGAALGYNPARNSLYLTGHAWYHLTAEVSIPQPVNSNNLNNLNTATVLQPFADVTDGKLQQVDPNYGNIGGQMVYNGKLVVSGYSSYDAAFSVTVSHGVSGLTLSSQGDFQGWYTPSGINPGFIGGYMTLIPREWQAALGGPALTGQCCISIITRTSFGPAAFVFNPDDLGTKNPFPVTPLVYYPSDHTTLGTYSGDGKANLYFNMSTEISGIVFPSGTRSVLFFGRQGIGTPCYGCGGSTNPGGDCATEWCYDPASGDKGGHAYPYVYYVWAYDANDLVAVKNGQKQPWDIRPYGLWTLTLPFGIDNAHIRGAAYDRQTQRIFITQAYGDDAQPIIYVFKVNGAASSDTLPPAAPKTLRVR